MTHRVDLKYQFVEFIPDELAEDTLYISIHFATATHLCCCGCRNKVVTPFQPSQWKLIFDGKSVSLSPSIGNWNFPCRSHYWIRNNRIQWAEEWSDDRIAAAKSRDRFDIDLYFASPDDTNRLRLPKQPAALPRSAKKNLWSKFKDRFWSR
jgi:Family of unknown function (DUF6527)